jgi:hypothetical protein
MVSAASMLRHCCSCHSVFTSHRCSCLYLKMLSRTAVALCLTAQLYETMPACPATLCILSHDTLHHSKQSKRKSFTATGCSALCFFDSEDGFTGGYQAVCGIQGDGSVGYTIGGDCTPIGSATCTNPPDDTSVEWPTGGLQLLGWCSLCDSAGWVCTGRLTLHCRLL